MTSSSDNDSQVVDEVLEEIALEGLDGITLQTLWIRLGKRCNGLSLNDHHHYNGVTDHNVVWSSILVDREVCKGRWQLFLLPEPRSDFVYYDRFAHVDPDYGVYHEDPNLIPDNIYFFNPVMKNSAGVRGSCAHFAGRQEVTDTLFQEKPSLDEVMSKYGNSLVIVASQEERNKCLWIEASSLPLMESRPRIYAFLELVGRMRSLGFITFGKETIPLDPSTSYYYRKMLKEEGLIRQTTFHSVNPSNTNNVGLIVFLKRFYRKRETPLERAATRLSIFLSDQPKQECEWSVMRENIDFASKKVMNNVMTHFSDNFEIFMKEYLKGEKSVRVKFIRLLAPVGADIVDQLDEVESLNFPVPVDDGLLIRKMKKPFAPKKILADRTMLSQVLSVIESSTSKDGLSLKEICEQLSLSFLDARTFTRALVRNGAAKLIKITVARTKADRYVAASYTPPHDNPFDVHFDSKRDPIEWLTRANIILQMLKESDRGVIVGLMHFVREIKKVEKDRSVVDSRSVARILIRLRDQDKVTLHKFSRVQGNRTYELTVTTNPDMSSTNTVLLDTIDQWMFNMSIRRKQSLTTKTMRKEFLTHDSLTEDESPPDVHYSYQPTLAKKYGALPKMRKIFMLYRFLLHQFHCDKLRNTVYDDWRRKMTPVEGRAGGKTFFTLGELVPRIPVALFCQVVNVTYNVPGLREILDDPEKKDTPIGSLPPEVTYGLMYRRRYIYSLLALLSYLTDMGLTEIEAKDGSARETAKIKLKDQIKFVVADDSKRSKKFTRQYKFESVEDIDELEEDLFRHACLECHGCSLPTTLFAHTARNWNYNHTSERKPTTRTMEKVPVDNESSEPVEIIEHPAASTERPKYRFKAMVNKCGPFQEEDAINLPVQPRARRKRKRPEAETDSEKPEESKRHKKYDEKDRQAQSVMTTQRSVWSQAEDHFLLLCRAASLLLDPSHNNSICVPSRVVRDELHKNVSVARDKTSQAIQRRILYLMKNENTNRSVSHWVSELRQDEAFFDVTKPMAPKTNEEVWIEAYLHVLSEVLDKFFNNVRNDDGLALPDQVDLSQFAIVESTDVTTAGATTTRFQDPKNVVDIHVSVMNNVLLASLLTSSKDDDPNHSREAFSYALFRIYQRYPDSLIRSVVASLKKSNAISNVKGDRSKGKVTMKHTGITPYKISAQYRFLLNTKLFMDSLIQSVKTVQDYKLDDYSLRSTAAIITSLVASGRGSFRVEIPEDFITVDESSPFFKSPAGRWKPFKLDKKSHSRSILYAVREQLSAKSLKDLVSKIQDFLVLSCCNLGASVRNLPSLSPKFLQKMDRMTELKPPTTNTGTNKDVQLLAFIKSRKELGVNEDDLKSLPFQFSMDRIDALVERRVLFRVGVNKFRWVYKDCVSPWLVYSFTPSSSDTRSDRLTITSAKHPVASNVQYVAKVWRKPTGEVDNKALFSFMTAIVGFLMLHPGQKMESIMSHFNMSAPGTQIMEIVELLEAGDCITVTKIPVPAKCRLFQSRHTTPETKMESFYDASDSATLLLNRIKGHLDI